MKEEIINSIIEVCSGQDLSILRSELHRAMLIHIANFFRSEGYSVISEKPIPHKHIDRKQGGIEVQKNGFIDLFAEKDGFSVAIEFDDGTHIRKNSIEKLLQSDANMCIGIVKGRMNDALLSSNITRVEKQAKALNIVRGIWLIIVTEKIAKRV